MNLVFKKSEEDPKATDDFWYDLTSGGYIKPEDFLEDEEQIKKINEAIDLILEFEQGLYDNGLLEEM